MNLQFSCFHLLFPVINAYMHAFRVMPIVIIPLEFKPVQPSLHGHHENPLTLIPFFFQLLE